MLGAWWMSMLIGFTGLYIVFIQQLFETRNGLFVLLKKYSKPPGLSQLLGLPFFFCQTLFPFLGNLC